MIVRALAVQQPWAGLIANGTKRTEWRSWSTPYRGTILIVASRGRDREGTEEARRRGELTATDDAKGATLCVVDVVDVVWNDARGLYAWALASPRPVPVRPIKGKLNLYNETVPDSWRRHFSAGEARPKGSASEVRCGTTRGSRKSTPMRKNAPKKPGTRAAYETALRTWRAAGAPDGPLCRAVVSAERAWKGPRP